LPKTSEAVQAAKPRPALSYRAVIPAPDAWPPIKIRSSRDLTYDWIVRGIYLYGITALAILPMAAMAGPELPTILPFFAASVLITELSTSFLLFVWARASRTWSLLILACTYLFGGLMALFYLLTLPSGLIPDQAILGTALQSPGLLLNFWVTGYAILALIAILLEINGGQIRAARIGRAIQLAIVGALAAVLTAAALATIGRDWFPPIVRDQAWTDFTKIFVATDLMLLIVGIERAIRQRNVIFLLQGLVLTAMAFHQILSLAGPALYTLGWYAGRLSWFVSAFILFLFFIVQFARQQKSLTRSREALEERVAERTLELNHSIAQRDLLLRDVRDKTAAIERDAEVFQSIMATMAEALLLIDAQGAIIYENSAATAMLGQPLGAARSVTTDFEAFQLDGVTPIAREERPSMRCLRGEIINEFEALIRPPGSSSLKHLLGSARPIRDASGQQTGAVMVFRDVTLAKEIEHQLHQSQKLDAIGQLTGGVAHDFNNILTVITGTAEILIDGVHDRPDLQAIARMIDQAADRGAALTRHLLAFARKQPLQPRSVDVNSLVLETARLLRPTLGEQIDIETLLEDDVEHAHADPSQLSTALLNMAVNARDAMPNGGRLTLETSNVVLDSSYAQGNPDVVAGHYVMITVSDSGVGIPANLLDKVFEPFFTTKAVGKGTGLGLSMVYGFSKQSNGHIRISSEQGRGTTIKLFLPCSTERETQPARDPLPSLEGARTILVVEDDELLRNFVVGQLASLGYRTETAVDGNAALGLIEAGTEFDLLFTDVILPGGINGRRLAEEVACRRPWVKILFTSGYTDNVLVHHGVLDQDILLLAKPYRKSDLARMVQLALRFERTAISAVAEPEPLAATG